MISGLTGSGKTVLMRYLASLAYPDIYIIDPLNQYTQFDEELRYIPKQETPNELEEIATQLMARNNCTLIIEEAEQYIAQGRAMLPKTSMLIRMGRNWGIGIWATTRRIQDINKRFFDLAQHCFFFRCGIQSREYIANMIGPEYVWPRLNKGIYNKTGWTITTLPPYHCLHFNLRDETAEVITLELGAREHIVEAKTGRKSEAPREPGAKEEAKKPEEKDTNEKQV